MSTMLPTHLHSNNQELDKVTSLNTVIIFAYPVSLHLLLYFCVKTVQTAKFNVDDIFAKNSKLTH